MIEIIDNFGVVDLKKLVHDCVMTIQSHRIEQTMVVLIFDGKYQGYWDAYSLI
jgi:hypothetical protein